MKVENIEKTDRPVRINILTKIVSILFVLLVQIKAVAAWSFEDNVLTPMWTGISDFMIPIAGIILVAVGMGKASTIEGIPTWTKVLLGIIAVVVCLVLAAALGTIGDTDIGQKFEDFFGDINIFN
jgi:hypothetical protein